MRAADESCHSSHEMSEALASDSSSPHDLCLHNPNQCKRGYFQVAEASSGDKVVDHIVITLSSLQSPGCCVDE